MSLYVLHPFLHSRCPNHLNLPHLKDSTLFILQRHSTWIIFHVIHKYHLEKNLCSLQTMQILSLHSHLRIVMFKALSRHAPDYADSHSSSPCFSPIYQHTLDTSSMEWFAYHFLNLQTYSSSLIQSEKKIYHANVKNHEKNQFSMNGFLVSKCLHLASYIIKFRKLSVHRWQII